MRVTNSLEINLEKGEPCIKVEFYSNSSEVTKCINSEKFTNTIQIFKTCNLSKESANLIKDGRQKF